jgi:50S ribosomal subunit-associated GTPase HflX
MEFKFGPNIGNDGSGENAVETRVDFVAERLKELLRQLGNAEVDEIEDVRRDFLGSSLSNAWGNW